MRRWDPVLLLFAALLAGLLACAADDGSPAAPGGGDDPVPRGQRILALDVNEAAGVDYWTALQTAVALGVQDVKLSFDWDHTLASFGGDDLPAIVNATFAMVDCRVTLVLRPVDTASLTYPPGVPTDPLDHPEAVAAFAAFVDSIWVRTPDVRAQGKLRTILVGNEVDGQLGADADRWAAFGRFLAAARAHILSLDWGAQPPLVGAVLMFGGATDTTVRQLYTTHVLPHCDQAVVNYYPLATDFTMRQPADVAADFQQLVDLFPAHPLRLQECGYSSGTGCGSSEVQQADFVDAVFAAWDQHAERIVHVDFTWQHDRGAATVDGWVVDYGMAGHPHEDAFRAYLATLGLRHHDGTAKPAWQRLVDAAAARGW